MLGWSAPRSLTVRALAALASIALATSTGCARLLEASVDAQRVNPRDLIGARASVVDLRAPDDFAAGHVPGAVNVAMGEVDGFLYQLHKEKGPSPLVLACQYGYDAALAAPIARMHGFDEVQVLGGGMARYLAEGLPLERGGRGAAPPSATRELALTQYQQWLSVIAGLGIKPVYMALSLAILILTRRRAKAAGLSVLWHGLLWFFIGEAFCALNLAWHSPGRIYLNDAMHGFGMALMSALIPWGLFTLFDERVLRYSNPALGCRLQPLCGQCWKRDPVRCGFHDLMLMLLGSLAVVSLIPLTGRLRPEMVEAVVLGTRTDFGVPVLNLWIELRLYPALAVVGFLATLAVLGFGGQKGMRPATPLFFLSFGFLSYSALRFFLSEAFGEAFWWANFWEELTELFFVAAIGMFLFLFRRQLSLAGTPAGDRTPSAIR